MKTLSDTQKYLKDTAEILTSMPDQMSYFEAIIEIGESLQIPLDMSQARLVPGCLSKVWVCTEIQDDRVYVTGEAEALIVKGYVGILAQALSDLTVEELFMTRPMIEEFIGTSKVTQSALPTRANAFPSIYKSITQINE